MLVAVKNTLPDLKKWQSDDAAMPSGDPSSEEALRSQILQEVDTVEKVVLALKRVEGMKQTLLKQTQVMLTAPMDKWLLDEINPILENEAKLVETRKKIDKLKKKVDSTARSSSSSRAEYRRQQIRAELQELQNSYDKTNLDYVLGLRSIESHAYFNLAQYLNAFMFANLSFFRQGGNLLGKLDDDLRIIARKMQGAEDDQTRTQEEQKSLILDRLREKQHEPTELSDQKQGFLKLNNKPVWFHVEHGIMSYYRRPADDVPKGQVDLLLCTVKPEPSEPNTFLVISPDSTLKLESPSSQEMEKWIHTIQAAILSQLETHKRNSAAKKGAQQHSGSTRGGLAPLAILQQSDESNFACVDCDSPNPDWASINWGILMCYECSGVHRSLGTHISKVRSLTLDKWDTPLMNMMKVLGNAKINSILEANRDPKYVRPTATSNREVRQKYINLKYREKKFVQTLDTDVNVLSKEFSELAARMTVESTAADLIAMTRMLVRGANVNVVNFAENNTTPLHFLAAFGNVVGCEFLLQNDASLSVVDIKGWTPIHYAAFHNQPNVARLLMNRGAILNLRDANGLTAYDLALQNSAIGTIEFLAGAMGLTPPSDPSEPAPSSSSSSTIH
ncbi:MAG: ankyrin repeat domain-containing protein [archaeon]|nr:ankyrin repeat domain-containing protein [archaeon]